MIEGLWARTYVAASIEAEVSAHGGPGDAVLETTDSIHSTFTADDTFVTRCLTRGTKSRKGMNVWEWVSDPNSRESAAVEMKREGGWTRRPVCTSATRTSEGTNQGI